MSRNGNLTHRAVQAAKWSYLGNAARALLQFAAGIVLARLLGPEAFGVVAIAWIMIGLGTLVADAGFGVALVQAPTLAREDKNFAFTVQLAIGALFTALGMLLAGPIAAVFDRPDAAPVIQAMAVMFIIRAFSQTQTALMNRELRYKATQLINIASYAIGYLLLGVPAAFLGYGAWSLVVAQLAQSFGYSVAIHLISSERLALRFTPGPAGLVRFGAWIMATNLMNWLLSNVDSIVVGHAFGATALGVYNRSLVLMSTPMTLSVKAMQGVLMSTVSRAPGDDGKARRAYLATNQVILAMLAPILLAAAVVPETIVLGVYGPLWSQAIPLIAPLALAMLAHSLVALIGPVLNARGKVHCEFFSQAAALVFSAVALFHAYTISIEAVAWAISAIYLFRLLTLSIFLAREISPSIPDLLKIVAYPGLIAVVVTLSALLADRHLAIPSQPLKLLAIITISGASYLGAVIAFGSRLAAGEAGQAIAQSISLPVAVRRWLNL